jgi:hypothetical protein
MKTYKLYLFIVLYLSCRISYCDIIPPNSHYVNKCVVITNVNDYPDISLLGVTNCMAYCPTIYLIGSTTCLDKGYKFNCLTIYGVSNSYLAGKDITTIDWSKDKHAFKTNIQIDPAGGYADNSNLIYSINQYYRIVGFTDNSVVLYKCKEIDYFCNGSIAVSSIGKYSGDSTKLSQSLPTGTKAASGSYGTAIDLFPNPAQKSFRLKLTNSYRGNVSVKIYTIDGKSVRTFNVNKSEILMDYLMHADNLAKGSYFVNIIMGNAIETKKVVIE